MKSVAKSPERRVKQVYSKNISDSEEGVEQRSPPTANERRFGYQRASGKADAAFSKKDATFGYEKVNSYANMKKGESFVSNATSNSTLVSSNDYDRLH